MLVYHGSADPNFKPQPHICDRYSFTAVFATGNKILARKYAEFNRYYSASSGRKGFLYQFEIPDYLKRHDFKGQITHSSVFRNLMYDLSRQQHSGVIITNCYDYPNETLKDFDKSDIVVIFNLDLIKNITLIETLP